MSNFKTTDLDEPGPGVVTAGDLVGLRRLDPGWQPIETAPKDGTVFLAWAPGREGLPPMFSLCAWHPDGGFCIDELREATNWMPLPEPPEVVRG